MAEDFVQVNFRMPGRLKERLEREADENARSLTAEIVYRLERSLGIVGLGAANAAPEPGSEEQIIDQAFQEIEAIVNRYTLQRRALGLKDDPKGRSSSKKGRR